LNSKERAVALAQNIVSKQGADVRVLEMSEVSSFTDFLILATGTSSRHVKALADGALETARFQGERPLGVEGDPPGRWILVDLGDVIIHLFEEETREQYSLEKLWGEAVAVELPPEPLGAVAQAGP